MLSQMSNGMHSWEDATQPPSQQSPFSTSPAVNATSAHESCAPYKPSNAAIYSNLVRRSRSLTDADMESLDAEVQPSGRRRSFFSPRKPKAATDHPSNSTLDAAAARSFSGLLPNHLGREDSRSLLDSDRDGATSFTRRNSKADDTDISAGKAKSAKWWSWGSTKAPPKPDGKVPNPVRQNSLPPSAIEPVPQGVLADVGESSLDQQQASGTFQDGYANLLSGLDSHDIPATANGHAAAADTLAPSQHQGGSHSRRVSWDDSIFDGPTASTVARIPDESQDRGLQPDGQSARSMSQRADGLHLPDNSALQASTSSMLTPALVAPAMATGSANGASAAVAPALTSTSEAGSPGTSTAAVSDGEKKKGHRRGRSLTGLIPNLKTKPKRSVSELLPAEPTNPAAASNQARPKTPDAKAASSNSSLVQCFGMGRTLDDAAEKEEAPPGVVGLRNLGNTCFVNVALQCLRYTPQLATSIIPDLMTLSPLPEEGSFSDSNLALPRISLQQSPVKHNGQQEVHQADSHQHFSTAAQEQSKDASRDPSELQLMNGESGAHREPGASLLRIPEVASVTAPSQQYDEGKPHSSQGLSQSTQAFQADALDSAQLALQQQPGSTQIQGSGPHDQQQQQHQQAHPTAANAHGPAAAQADGTTAEQQSPVLPVCVPLKKGEIADSFRALVREVYSIGGHNSRKEAVDPAQFLRRISQLSAGAEFCDGGQHDGHELLRLLLHSLHDDLNRIKKAPAYEEDTDIPGEAEGDKANRFWRKYLQRDNSPITDLFGGQLQSTVHCHQCKGNFTTYEPFWDLSVPIAKEGKTGISAWLSGKTVPSTIQDCLQAFTGDEVLQGDESFKCEVCAKKTQATKRMRLHRLPKVLLLHIKRFKYSGSTREKLTANVSFPTKGFKLNQFVSADSSAADSNASYDLYAVSNHFGSMAGGHYTAACRVGLPDGREQWYNFNDTAVAKLSPAGVVSPCAYILFYVRVD